MIFAYNQYMTLSNIYVKHLFFFESVLSYSIKKAFQSMYQIEEKGMKTRNHGFSPFFLIQVNQRYAFFG